MAKKCELAKKRFTQGFHCSQAVLEAFAEDYGLDPILARKIANPLAGGSGLGGECGAVIGGFMVLGLEYGMEGAQDSDAFQKTFEKVGQFAEEFCSRHGALNCRELIGLDVFVQKDFEEFVARDIKLTRCIRFVEDAVGIAETIISSEKRDPA